MAEGRPEASDQRVLTNPERPVAMGVRRDEFSYEVQIVRESPHSGTPIRTLLKPGPDKETYHLFVANPDDAPVSVRFTTESVTIGSIEWVSGDDSEQFAPSARPDPRAFNCVFEPYESGALKIAVGRN